MDARESRSSGKALNSLVFYRQGTGPESSYQFSFKDAASGAAVTREAVIGIAAYSGVAATEGLHKSATDANPCGGETPVLLLSWSDRHSFSSPDDTDVEVSYNATVDGDETHLVRRRCEALSETVTSGTPLSGIPESEQTLASNLAPATAYASCVSSSAVLATTSTTAATATDFCSYLPVTVTMSLTEPPGLPRPPGRTYLMRASTRTDRDAE